MSYTSISASDLTPGKPVKAEVFDLVRTNLDDLDSRVSSVEAATVNIHPLEFNVFGKYHLRDAPQVLPVYVRAAFDLTITGCQILLFDDGTSGTLEIDIQKKSGVGAFTSIFTTKPSIVSGSGDFTLSTNAVLSGSQTSCVAGDIFRLHITSNMAGPDVDGFKVFINYSV